MIAAGHALFARGACCTYGATMGVLQSCLIFADFGHIQGVSVTRG